MRALMIAAMAAGLIPQACANEPTANPAGPAAKDSTAKASATATHILLTDDPFPYDRVARVDVYVVNVSVSLSPDTSSTGSFVTVATPNRRINVLALQGGDTEELGALKLPPGIITAVRLVLDTDSSSITLADGRVLTGSSSPGIAWQSSAGRPVLNALVHDQIAVPDSGGRVVIVFDVGEAFIPVSVLDSSSTDSGFVFSPFFTAFDGTRTGAIAGIVRGTSDGGAAVTDASLQLYLGNPANPENTWWRVGTARTDSAGTFRFAYVTPSAHWTSTSAHASDTYILTVDPPNGSELGRVIVPNIEVTTGNTTSIGPVVLP